MLEGLNIARAWKASSSSETTVIEGLGGRGVLHADVSINVSLSPNMTEFLSPQSVTLVRGSLGANCQIYYWLFGLFVVYLTTLSVTQTISYCCYNYYYYHLLR
jgi:hypothetical protein